MSKAKIQLQSNAKDNRKNKANAIRTLSMDAVQKANSGHPGAPMGMADIAEVLWGDYLRHHPKNPQWPNRDRFVLSNGHGSMLLYALLHLSGYELTIGDIKQFRQLHSKTPGHPEYGYTPGVETTTGPLGQGLANAVGLALAERIQAERFNQEGYAIVDHNTYVFVGDGCLMEGISHEACSLAGTLGLGKLIVFYDDNGISIDGEVEAWFADDTPKRFEAYGWQVIPDVDGHDASAIKSAIDNARSESGKPSLICCKTIIGWGSPNKQGKESCHGAPLGDDEVLLSKKALDWNYGPFEIPDEIYAAWSAVDKGAALTAAWEVLFADYQKAYPELALEFERIQRHALPESWKSLAQNFIEKTNQKAEKMATRKASQCALDVYGDLLPELIGGSADLTGSNLTLHRNSQAIGKGRFSGNYIYYGVREFGMAAMMNGMALYGGLIPYGGTFLVFSEYARNALRMAALMRLRSIFVFTHDSIGLGEDGPTHQAVEQLSTLRLIPNMSVWRPCDTVETAVAWKLAIERQTGPTCLALSRQGLPCQQRSKQQISNIERGGYVLLACEGQPDAVVIATGSEVDIAKQAVILLQAKGRKISLVSMPSTDAFEQQPQDYKDTVLPPTLKRRIAVEAGVSDYWWKYVGLEGKVLGVDRFGESAPAEDVFKHFGLTVENIVSTVERLFH